MKKTGLIHTKRAGSIFLVICMIAGMISPAGPMTTKVKAAETSPPQAGSTYYFDLSSTNLTSYGSNISNYTLPDSTLHYVPFTYTGSINAYALKSASSGVKTSSAAASATTDATAAYGYTYDHSLFVADFAVRSNMTWNAINGMGYIFGKDFGSAFTMRAPSGGASSAVSPNMTPTNNEFTVLENMGYIKHPGVNGTCAYYMQDTVDSTVSTSATIRMERVEAGKNFWRDAASCNTVDNYRPVLEVKQGDESALRVVTLHLNGGSFSGSSNDMQIICDSTTYTAPSNTGLTRPSNNYAGFSWNTTADGTGTSYEPGDKIPSSVTDLYAQWYAADAAKEQFSLAVGGTYYFDLYGQLAGTTNGSLPDTSCHYVPFTYAGTVDAYSLQSGSQNTSGSVTGAANTTDANSSVGYRSARSLFVSEYVTNYNVAWSTLNGSGLIYGKNYEGGKYVLRSLSGGSQWDANWHGDLPVCNEWDMVQNKLAAIGQSIGNLNYWTMMQDTHYNDSSVRTMRGSTNNPVNYSNFSYSTSYGYIGYRPTLEVRNASSLGKDGLQVVTLNLNGGSFNNSQDDIQIICAGDSYTAPSSSGLTRPLYQQQTGFSWNTKADGSGTTYLEGATVPNTVTKLYARWEASEQFSLSTGKTYYFDLSYEKTNFTGTNNSAMPDPTRHYVPFTYVGTINAYKLTAGHQSDSSNASAWASNTTTASATYGYRYDHSLFIADYNVINNVAYSNLLWGWTHGNSYDNGKYQIRMPSGGYNSTYSGGGQYPTSNEWDQILNKSGTTANDGWIKNWQNNYSYVQDIYSYSTDGTFFPGLRGYSYARNFGGTSYTNSNATYGYRPVLEVLNPATVGYDGLKEVTLHLDGGKLNGNTDDIQIICNGDSYTAPPSDGLTRPDSSSATDVGFHWNTAANDTGTSYDPGDTIPDTVTQLYAQWTNKKTEEQFTLETGKTYYFDLSSEKTSIPGTTNSALPDTTRHYVPFTYTGTINAYKLTAGHQANTSGASVNASNSTDPNNAYGYRYDHSLFMADNYVTYNVAYSSLYWGWTHGISYDNGKYQIRMPSGGINSSYQGVGQYPNSNEWDQILRKSGTTSDSGWIKNTSQKWTMIQDIYAYSSDSVFDTSIRKGTSWSGIDFRTSSVSDYVYRPVLEVLNPDTLNLNGGLQAVTLDLNGGSFDGSTDSIQIVCAGSSYTAPSKEGLTRPTSSSSTDIGFHWNTEKDDSGTNYNPGDTIPNTVTALYAQWKNAGAKEQFSLETGKTYYFDLSYEKVNIPGTVNGSLPDTTRHYVPFTYTGTINAYKLTAGHEDQSFVASANAANSTNPNNTYGYRYDHSLFIADYNVTNNTSWWSFAWGLSNGTNYEDGKYQIRMPSGGYNTSYQYGGYLPTSNEWDQIINKSGTTANDGWIKNSKDGLWSMVQDFYSYSSSDDFYAGMRGAGSVRNYGGTKYTYTNAAYGYRPVLEVLNPTAVGYDGLKAVTLHLDGGKLGGSTDDIEVVCNGSSYKAPSGDGLSRPDGSSTTDVGFHWNTAKDDGGTTYQPGDTIPDTVTELYAQWESGGIKEQFTLETGKTYYFDLSTDKANIPGTTNSALPDTTRHYVPFTYTGTINAYKLTYGHQDASYGASNSAASSTNSNNTYGYRYDHSLFMADDYVTNRVAYNTLAWGWTHGVSYDSGKYQIRMPSGGYNYNTAYKGVGQYPNSNEWDQILRKSGTTSDSGWIKNTSQKWTMVQDIYAYRSDGTFDVSIRNGVNWSGLNYTYVDNTNGNYVYRPVLEVMNPDTLNQNGGLQAVTLDLNGGRFNGSTDPIQIVCAGASYTAPSFTGLTRPTDSGTYGFHWNTKKDGTGDVYEDGDTVPNTVTTLYAQWKTDDTATEQFTLETGKTYYFDLSGTNLNNLGSMNSSLPDTSLRYVPFTYAGTVNAYVLKSASSGVTGAALNASKSTDAVNSYGYRYAHSLFVSNDAVRTGITWDTLNGNGYIFGKDFDNAKYKLRTLSGGSRGVRLTDGYFQTSGSGTSGWPVNNEWDQIQAKSSSLEAAKSVIKNWNGKWIHVQDTFASDSTNRGLRGNSSATAYAWVGTGSGYAYYAALEVMNPTTLGKDGLKAVTLELNGGKFNGSTDAIQVVCAGDSYTAPSGLSITRPSGITTTGFHWNTQQDDKGTDYQPGDTVPKTVTTLYAQFVTSDKVDEQFSLETGGTYYFDLSNVSGAYTSNSNLPDTTYHYVPFTYAGTINAYALKSAAAGVTNAANVASKTTDAGNQYGYTYDHSLFVSDYNTRINSTWNWFSSSGYIYGRSYDDGKYTMRTLSGGNMWQDSLLGGGGTPSNNEWDQLLNKGGTSGATGLIKNWSGIYSHTQDTQVSNSAYRILRGNGFAVQCTWTSDANAAYYGYRPVLEVNNPDKLGTDGLKAVTLHLNGGKLNGSTDDIKIICAGDSFKAPNALGLTDPDGTAATSCWWSTQADGAGTAYRIGDTVPETVTELYANWNNYEQYKLQTGTTYYFDLSSYSYGTVNAGSKALTYGGKSYGYEDTTRHYVPFTYVGTINAYVLNSNSQNRVDTSASAAGTTVSPGTYGYRYDHSLFVSSKVVATDVAWGSPPVFTNGVGNFDNGNYGLRYMTAGSLSGTATANPATNEFDQIIKKNSSWASDLLYSPCWQWAQDTSYMQESDTTNHYYYYRTLRGHIGAAMPRITYGNTSGGAGWRPVLEVNSQKVTSEDALLPITLDLNGSTLDGKSSIQMICIGDTYTAPGGEGLTRPNGNTTQYFNWNTKKDGTGTTYVKGDTIPKEVTTLYAQWKPIEQFSLTTGNTYYFDLTGQDIPGTVNGALPGGVLNYVPFTYTGTQYSYALKEASNKDQNSSAVADKTEDVNSAVGYRYNHSLFVSDYYVSSTSQTALNSAGLIFGKDYQTNYRLRSLSGGENKNVSTTMPAYDAIDEWDQILNKAGSTDNTTGWLKNWNVGVWNMTQDTCMTDANQSVERGKDSARAIYSGYSSSESRGYRAALEVLNADTLGYNGLIPITLNLNGGSVQGKNTIQIVATGSTYTAPGATGLTRPSANTTYFMWNTQQDGSGTEYAPGDAVPVSVKTLYAQWAITKEQIDTLPVGNTYYFDLSGLTGYSIGSINSSSTTNPDATLHYVPFTFDGAVDAYRLKSAAQGNVNATATASATEDPTANLGYTYVHSLFTANYRLTTGVSWNMLNAAGLIYGQNYQNGQYTLRTLSGGQQYTNTGANNEFDAIGSKVNSNGLMKTWEDAWDWTQDQYSNISTAMMRVKNNSNNRSYTTGAIASASYAYVPALEVMNAEETFTPIRIDFNGGSLGTNKSVEIVCVGDTYTAPSDIGLTRPAGNAGKAFHWNTRLDNTGTNYEPGDTVAKSVTTLYAQWTTKEQYTLPVGETYYFDLSGQSIPGAVNSALPDTTLHYVPMTYGGTINAYVLNASSTGNQTASATASDTTAASKSQVGYRYDHSVFLSDYPMTTATVSWDNLNAGSLIYGKAFGDAYTLRTPSGGNYNGTNSTTDPSVYTPNSDEWDALLMKNSGFIKNPTTESWVQDTSNAKITSGNTFRNARKFINMDWWGSSYASGNVAYRPLLEVNHAVLTNETDMTAVTLNLNGGSLAGNSSIKIVCSADQYTAPSATGLTRPTGNTDTYFSWNTRADGTGTAYAPGAKVDRSVTTLYAQWSDGFSVQFTTAGIEGKTDSYVFTGQQVRPAVQVIYNASNTVAPASSYSVTYKDNIAAGTATVTVSGATIGTITKQFSILYDMSKMTLSLLNPLSGTTNEYAFNGAAVTPDVALSVNGAVIPSSAYTVSYANNTKASLTGSAADAKLTVTPVGSKWVDLTETKSANYALIATPIITTDNTEPIQSAIIGSTWSRTLEASGTTPVTWKVESGALPDGLTLDTATGVISGTPTKAGTFTAVISAANAAGTDQKSFVWNLGTVAGRMTYTDGTGASGVTLTFTSEAGSTLATLVTDADGYYQDNTLVPANSTVDITITPPSKDTYPVRMKTASILKSQTLSATEENVFNGTLEKSVKITLVPGNGTLEEGDEAVTYQYPGDGLKMPTTVKAKDTAEHFIGWFTTATGSKEAPAACPTEDSYYYAQYNGKSYTVLYDTDGGGSISPKGVDYTSTGLLPTENPSKEGYTFVKWVAVGKEDVTLTQDTEFSSLVAGTTDQKVYLKAVWSILKDIQVTLDANGTTAYPATIDGAAAKTYTDQTYGTAISYPTPVREGYIFQGWSTKTTAAEATGIYAPVTSLQVPGANATYYAIWQSSQNTVEYNAMGGEFATGVTGTYKGTIGDSYQIPTVSRTGYTFKGWYTSPTGTEKAPADGLIPTSSAVYYAQWEADTVTLTLQAAGGTPETQTVTGKYGETVQFTIPQKSGATFSGWKIDDTTTEMFLTFPAEDATYQAVFTAGSVAVVFNPNGGTFTGSETGVRNGDAGNSYTAPTQPVRSGYTFGGWYTTLECTTAAPTDGVFPPLSVTYYAKWTPNQVAVTLNAEGADTAATQTVTGDYGSVLSYTVPTRSGYAFVGWKETDAADETAQMFLTMPAAATTYVAVWMENASVVTFNPMGGSFSGNETGVRTGVTAGTYTKPADPTRSGYVFDGWYTESAAGEKVTTLGTYPSDANTTYYAHWKANDVTVTLDANGGTITTSQYTGAYGENVEYTAPTRDGYTFKGWKLANALDSSAKVSLTFPAADITYVAVWTANDITVTFDANGGKIGENTTSSVSGAPLESLTAPVPTREGYTFAGWYTSPTTGTSPSSIRFGYADTTYFAHWTANTITATLDPNGGSIDGKTEAAVMSGSYGSVI